MAEPVWTVATAKARLSELIQRASRQPQTITRRGRAAVVVVSVEEWARRTQRQGSLADFFAASPLQASGLEIAPRERETAALEL